MGEQYVRPPLVAREAPPAWHAVWRFRLAALVVLAVLVLIGYRVFQHFSGATAQDPAFESAPTLVLRG